MFLDKVIIESKGHMFNLTIVDKHFPDKEIITAQEFFKSAETGDVLLFKYKTAMNKVSSLSYL